MRVGDKVRIKAPFEAAFPDVYTIIGTAEAVDTFTVDVFNDGAGSDFSIDYLEAA